jgi:prophage regulatory protein
MRERLIRLKEVIAICGMSRSRIYQYINEDKFPASVSLGGRSIGFVESEINQWVENVIGQRDNSALSGYDMEIGL